jgi:hypothetical protein
MSKPRSSPAMEYNHVSRELRRLGTGTRGATTGLRYRPTVRGRWKIPIGRATSRIESLPAWPQWPRSPQARKPPKPPKPPRATGCNGKFPTGDGISLGLDWLDGAACQRWVPELLLFVPSSCSSRTFPFPKPAGPARCTLRCTVHTLS